MHTAKNHNDKQLSLINGSKSSYTNEKYDFENQLSFIDLFAGIGGFRLGLEALNINCLFSSEWDLNAKKTYQKNFGELPHGDINDVKIETIPKFDILTAGFPCQPFSKIGMRQGFKHKTQGNLFFNIAEILRKKKTYIFYIRKCKRIINTQI